MLWHYSCIEELCPHFVRKNGFGALKTIGITALFRFCGLFPLGVEMFCMRSYSSIFVKNGGRFSPISHSCICLFEKVYQAFTRVTADRAGLFPEGDRRAPRA